MVFFNGNLLCIASCVSRVHFGVVVIFFLTKNTMAHNGSANWEVRTETPFSVMTRSGFTFRMSSQTRRISSYGVGFSLRSNLFPAVPWVQGPLLNFKKSSLPTIILQVPSCQFSEEYWSTGSYYLRSSPPLAAGAFPQSDSLVISTLVWPWEYRRFHWNITRALFGNEGALHTFRLNGITLSQVAFTLLVLQGAV